MVEDISCINVRKKELISFLNVKTSNLKFKSMWELKLNLKINTGIKFKFSIPS